MVIQLQNETRLTILLLNCNITRIQPNGNQIAASLRHKESAFIN